MKQLTFLILIIAAFTSCQQEKPRKTYVVISNTSAKLVRDKGDKIVNVNINYDSITHK